MIDVLLMTIINIACAFLIWEIGWEDYGSIAGYTAGLLFLVISVFTEGYFLFSEQFCVLFLLLAFIMARRSAFAGACVFLALASGFKQYALFVIIPLLYMMWSQPDRRYYHLLLPVILITAGMFGALYLVYGIATGNSAVYYTFLVAPSYIAGNVNTFSTYVPETPLAFAANLIFSVAVVHPVLLFALASAARRGFRNPPGKSPWHHGARPVQHPPDTPVPALLDPPHAVPRPSCMPGVR